MADIMPYQDIKIISVIRNCTHGPLLLFHACSQSYYFIWYRIVQSNEFIALLNPCFIAAIQLSTCVVEKVLVHSNKGFHSPSQNLN